jgi:hypothetical protein
VHERRVHVAQPPQRVERNEARVADEDESFQLGACSVEATRTTVTADAILDNEMSAVDADLDAVAVGHDDAVLGGASLGLHTKPLLVCHAPDRVSGAGAICLNDDYLIYGLF